jgi:hypothetical protein
MRSPINISYNADWRRKSSPSPLPPPSPPTLDPGEPNLIDSPEADLLYLETTPLLPAPATPLEPVQPTKQVEPFVPRMNITWNDDRKLRKGHYPGTAPTVPQPPQPAVNPQLPLTPETTPDRKKPSFISRFTNKPTYPFPAQGTIINHPPSPAPSHERDDQPEWKHHESYFPEYTPIYPTTTFADPYAKAYLLTPAEIQAQQHAARVGHAVAVHYPMLPPFADYSSGAKGQGAWQSGQWGTSNWTGFGLSGEKLPDTEGKTFGAPMPKGIPNPDPNEKEKKGKGGGGGGDGGGGGGGGDGGGGGGEGGGGGGEGGGEGGGGGGGGKKGKGKK